MIFYTIFDELWQSWQFQIVNFCDLKIKTKIKSGQHSQFLRCFKNVITQICFKHVFTRIWSDLARTALLLPSPTNHCKQVSWNASSLIITVFTPSHCYIYPLVIVVIFTSVHHYIYPWSSLYSPTNHCQQGQLCPLSPWNVFGSMFVLPFFFFFWWFIVPLP